MSTCTYMNMLFFVLVLVYHGTKYIIFLHLLRCVTWKSLIAISREIVIEWYVHDHTDYHIKITTFIVAMISVMQESNSLFNLNCFCIFFYTCDMEVATGNVCTYTFVYWKKWCVSFRLHYGLCYSCCYFICSLLLSILLTNICQYYLLISRLKQYKLHWYLWDQSWPNLKPYKNYITLDSMYMYIIIYIILITKQR